MAPPSASLPPNPCLVAILLVTRNRAGTRLVFHYPPKPSTAPTSKKRDPNWYGPTGNHTDDSDSADSDWSLGSDVGARSDDDEGSRSSKTGSKSSNKTSATRGSGKHDAGGSVRSSKARSAPGGAREELDERVLEEDVVNHGDGGNHDNTVDGKSKEQSRSDWEHILGFPAESLSTLLTPGRIFNKRKFEVSLDRLVFVGAPIFKREDGRWVKRRRRQKKRGLEVVDEDGQDDPVNGHDQHVPPTILSRTASAVDLHEVPGFESGYGHGAMSGAASDVGSEAKSTSSAGTDGDMTMFNVVFVLNPPQLEHHLRVDEMYNYVARKLAIRLKERQADTNFVSQEVLLIQSLKEKGKESRAPTSSLWQKIMATSVLATALAEVYDRISTNQIAHINLGAGAEPSFQIMQAVSTQIIPSATEPQMPGLWLTTATVIDDDDAEPDMSPYSALLLLEDDDSLLREVEGEGDKASELLSFIIRHLTPTKSLLKLSQMHSHAVSLNDVQLVARHLITWRRARAIHPLRGRDTYVVSPNANMAALHKAIPAFEKLFPTPLPSLPKMLNTLSQSPKPYNHWMPSPDHKEKYMEILAWLMRGGWVTQLRTFGWIKVTPDIKAAVADKMNAEAKASHRESVDTLSEGGSHTRSTSRQDFLGSPEARAFNPEWNGGLSPYSSGLARPPSDAGSAASNRTAIPSITASLSPSQRPESRTFHRASPLHINQSASPSSDELSTVDSQILIAPSDDFRNGDQAEMMSVDPADYDSSLIHSPQKANSILSRYIEHIGAGFTDAELKELWPLLLKYFDGRHALEEIPAREGLKKKRVERILKLLSTAGVLITVKHW
ncbi:Nitrogen permease regulator 3 [Venturia nashicola]|uniref:Nitrogen permease regulator 3 n=1 Tax=Venturia nashicola TaxID=86259 RepID=A0A4Z1PAH4_9PEZI|nr:Nitrogen permease regulator 3 [Venturia nashicola]